MKLTSFSSLIKGAFFALIAFACGGTAAQAQATRTWVSGVGDDANPCSRTAPCKTFAGAISKTAKNGEINCLDSGGFGAVTITKSITIKAVGVIGGILSAGTNGIIVNITDPTDVRKAVVIEGLDIDGAGTGLNGISISAGSKVFVINTTIRGCTQNGINMTSTGCRLFVDKSYIQNCGQSGAGFGGLNVAGTSNIATITNTEFNFNGNGAATGFAVNASSATASISLQSSVLNDSVIGLAGVAGAQIVSVGPSNFVGGSGAFTSTVLFK